MPKKTITVCTTCDKRTCDGAIWEFVKITEIEGNRIVDLKTLPPENLTNCSLGFGVSRYKKLRDKTVGDEVKLTFNNWVKPVITIVKKIEE